MTGWIGEGRNKSTRRMFKTDTKHECFWLGATNVHIKLGGIKNCLVVSENINGFKKSNNTS